MNSPISPAEQFPEFFLRPVCYSSPRTLTLPAGASTKPFSTRCTLPDLRRWTNQSFRKSRFTIRSGAVAICMNTRYAAVNVRLHSAFKTVTMPACSKSNATYYCSNSIIVKPASRLTIRRTRRGRQFSTGSMQMPFRIHPAVATHRKWHQQRHERRSPVTKVSIAGRCQW